MTFEQDLAFLHALSSPRYIHYLAQTDALNPEQLKYLTYLGTKEYIKHVRYPHALTFLELAQNEEWRNLMKDPENCEKVVTAQYWSWKNRQKDLRVRQNTMEEI